MQLNDLRVNLTLDNAGFRLSVAESGRVLRQFEQTLGSTADRARVTEGALGSFATRAHQMTQSLGMARFALLDLHDVFLTLPKSVLKSAGEIERLTTLMEGLSKESDVTKRKLEAASNVKFVFNMAKNAPFEVSALTDAFVKFKTGGVDPTNGSLAALVDGIAKFGGSSEQMHRASIAIQQMGGKGVISMEELRQQLGEAVPTAMQSMAIGMKMTMSELTKAVSDGTVSSTSAISKMLAVMAIDSAGSASRMMNTWTGMLERLKTQWELWKLNVSSEGLFDGAKSGLGELIELLKSKEAARFGREIGEGMSEALKSVISFVHAVSNAKDEIVIGGKLLLTYWAGTKVLAGMNVLKAQYDKLAASVVATRAANIADLESRQATMLTHARLMEERIAQNNAIIASNQEVANAARLARAQELADAIATNRAIIRNQVARESQLIGTMNAALPSNSPAVAAVARGTATAAQDLEAQVLLRHADAARVDAAEINHRTAALVAENQAMIAERNALLGSEAALTEDSVARAANNTHLQTQSLRLRTVAAAQTAMNTAMTWTLNAAATVGNAIKSMIFSMNGVVMAIMAAAWAWNYFSERAKEAAKNADEAWKAKERAARGGGNEDSIKSAKAGVQGMQSELTTVEEGLAFWNKQAKEGNNSAAVKEAIAKAKARRVELINGIAAANEGIAEQVAQVSRKQGETDGSALTQMWDEAITKKLDGVNSSVQKIKDKYAAIIQKNGKLTKEESESQKNELFAETRKGHVAQLTFWDQRAKDLDEEVTKQQKYVDSLHLAKDQMSTARDRLNELESARDAAKAKAANSAGMIDSMDSAVQRIEKDKKPKKPRLDAVQSELASSRVKLDKVQSALEAMDDKAINIADLRAAVDSHIEAIIESDAEKEVPQRHSPVERAELERVLERQALLDELKKRYGSLAKEREAIADQFKIANEKMLTGNFNLQGKTKEELQVDVLKTTLDRMQADGKVAKDVIEEYKKALENADAVLNGQNFVKSVSSFAENKKSIEALQVGNIVNDKERLRAQQALETRALQEKYEAQLKYATDTNGMRKKLQEQFMAEDLLLAQKHAEEMKTPLEKLGEQWADVTKNMETATAGWADRTMDAFVKLVSTGKIQFGDLVKSILADIIKIQVQAAMGSAVSGIAGYISTAANMYMGSSGGAGASSGAVDNTMFANGGIMTSLGSLPLKKYSNGGIANRPQLALFGEGRMNEAYVPLPDGRSIPVTIKGGSGSEGGQAGVMPNVTVNVINQTSSSVNAQQDSPRFDGRQMILDVVLTAASTPGPFRSGIKEAVK